MVAGHLHAPVQHAAPGVGRLFGDRYKAVLLEGASGYYGTVRDYVHLNP